MDSWINVVLAVIPPFLLLFIGSLSRKMDWLGKETDRTLSRFIICVLYPCFIVYHVLGSSTPVNSSEVWLASVFGFFAIVAGFVTSRLVCYVCQIEDKAKRAFCFCSGIFNYGFFAIPVASFFFGSELVVKIILFNLGVEVAIWTVGILILTSSKLEFRKIINPPAVSVVIALCLQQLGGRDLFPEFLWEVLSMIGNCSIPMALMIIGASFYDLLIDYRPSVKFRVELGSLLTRVLLVPTLFIFYARYGWIPQEVNWMRDVLVVQAAMPAGVFALVVVRNYGEDTKTGLRSIMATMLISVVSIPTWLWVGMTWATAK